MDENLTLATWWGEGDDVIVCVSGILTNPNTKTRSQRCKTSAFLHKNSFRVNRA